jgi:hypothetical protein
MNSLDQITIRQHVFPKSEIKRFCANGVVAVFHAPKSQIRNKTVTINEETPRLVGANAAVFVAKRAWDRNSEESGKSLMTITEKAYQAVAKKYAALRDTVGLKELSAEESSATTQFYILWQMRAHLRKAEQTPIILHGLKPDDLTGIENINFGTADKPIKPNSHEEALELIEKLGVTTCHAAGPDGQAGVHARQMYGFQIMLGMQQLGQKWGTVRWAYCCLPAANLFVPDQFDRFPYVPLSPTHCFIPLGNEPPLQFGSLSRYAGFATLSTEKLCALIQTNPTTAGNILNDAARAAARDYYFRRP